MGLGFRKMNKTVTLRRMKETNDKAECHNRWVYEFGKMF